MIRVQAEGFNELSRVLADASSQAPEEAKKIAGKGALNIKTDWRRRWSGLAHAPALPYAITYDVRASGTYVEAEIGPDKAKRQGALGNLLEFGSIKNAPRPGGSPALDREGPRFVKYLEDLAARLIEEDR